MRTKLRKQKVKGKQKALKSILSASNSERIYLEINPIKETDSISQFTNFLLVILDTPLSAVQKNVSTQKIVRGKTREMLYEIYEVKVLKYLSKEKNVFYRGLQMVHKCLIQIHKIEKEF